MASSRSKSIRLDDNTLGLVRRLLQNHVRPHYWRIGVALVCMAIAAASTAALAKLMEPVLDDVFFNRDQDRLIAIGAMVLGVFLAKGMGTFGQSVLMNFVGFKIIADFQERMFAHLMRADLAFFHANSAGGLVSRFINDVQVLRKAVSDTLTGIGKDTLTLAFLIAVMFYQDWALALVAFFAFPTAVLPIVKIGRRMRRVSATTQDEIGGLSTLLDEAFQGVRHVKAYGMEEYEKRRANAAIQSIFRLLFKATTTRALTHPIMETLGGIAIVAVIYYGGSQVIAGEKTPGTFFSFMTALLLAYEPMKKLANLNANLQEGLAAAQRIFTLIDVEPGIVSRPGAPRLAVAGGEVRFEAVDFGYAPDQPALESVDLLVPAGKTVALVGPSGAGKSTILNLIPRFYDIEGGAVRIDGQDVREVNIASLRAAIGLVSQEIALFDDTVRANIAYGRPEASEAEIVAAAEQAGADGFITGLPSGYDTHVGGRGVKLSGGQRQRLAIARAMLKNAPILLLDEATSALDANTERQVQAALKELMRGRTTLVVAHRLSTVLDADIIYVMEGGRVIESGSHGELMARGAVYARLYARRAGEDTPEEVLKIPSESDPKADTATDSTTAGARAARARA
ncbi:MAG: ATP-binding cassette domain-containing protein [Rhodospirillaceae bacterium]|nr:ATP-binding cassette domain-containing protein [Rhodospirillaceae bacterium]